MNRSFLGGWVKLVGANGVTALLQLGAFAIAARTLDLAVLGMLVLIQTYVRVVDGLFNFQSVNVLTRFLAEAEERRDANYFAGLVKAGFAVDAGTALLATIVALAALPLAAPLMGLEDGWLVPALLFCLLIPTRLLGAAEAALRCFDGFGSIGMRTVMLSGMMFAGSAAAWFTGAGPLWFLAVWFAAEALANVWFVARAIIVVHARQSQSILAADASGAIAASKGFWPMMWQTNATFAIRMLSQDADVLVAGSVLGPAAASLLRAAKNLAGILGQLGRPLQQVASAPISRLWAVGDTAGMARYSRNLCLMAGSAGLVAVAGAAIIGGPLLDMLFGAGFVDAKWALVALLLTASLYLAGITLLPVAVAIGRGGIVITCTVLGTVVFAALLFLLTLPYEITGIALAHVGFNATWLASSWWLTMRALKTAAAKEKQR